jgi:hypothetical protein
MQQIRQNGCHPERLREGPCVSQSGKKVNRKVLHSGAKNAPPFRMTVALGETDVR